MRGLLAESLSTEWRAYEGHSDGLGAGDIAAEADDNYHTMPLE